MFFYKILILVFTKTDPVYAKNTVPVVKKKREKKKRRKKKAVAAAASLQHALKLYTLHCVSYTTSTAHIYETQSGDI